MGKINVLLFTKDERYCAKISDWFARFCDGEFSFVAAHSCEFADKLAITDDSVVLVGEEFAGDIVLPKGVAAARLVSGNGGGRSDGSYSFCKYQSGADLRAAILAFHKHALSTRAAAAPPPPPPAPPPAQPQPPTPPQPQAVQPPEQPAQELTEPPSADLTDEPLHKHVPTPAIIVVAAVSGGAGATTCALAVAKRNAKAGVKTLFLSFDYFGSLSHIFADHHYSETAESGIQGLSLLINTVTDETIAGDTAAAHAVAKSLIHTDAGGVMYVREVATPAQYSEVSADGAALALESLIAAAAELSASCVVIDVPYLNREFWKAAAYFADTIIAVAEKNIYSDNKLARFAETVATDDILHNTDNARKVKYLRNKVTAGLSLHTNVAGKEDGTPEVSKIVGAYGDFAAIADIMSASGVWGGLGTVYK